ncbi:gamma-glutamyl-gamma-aminobutyrate hydrolase family protein, partial [Alphaproteobacteria bacterium]|nr:gamma-glutamyl-gamma-aminobutyrate hydrolase family protein [Alphaproteobacteria bacterium]
MNSDKIVVVDFGIGNLFSVESALKKCGVQSVSISSDAIDIANADRLILPGVGSFRNGVKSLKRHGLNAAIKSHSIEGKPLLGICLGMQLLATTGTEYGESEGLDIIPGRV